MIAPDPAFVRHLRRRTRALVKASPELSRYRRGAPSVWQRQFQWPLLRWLLPPGIFVAAYTGMPAGQLLGVGVIWTLCVTLYRTGQLRSALYSPESLWLFFQLPVTNAEVFRHQWTQWWRGSAGLGFDWLAVGLGYALRAESRSLGLLTIAMAITQWAVAFAFAIWAVRLKPRLPYGEGGMICWFLVLITSQFYGNPSVYQAFVRPLVSLLTYATPGGWLILAMQEAAVEHPAGWLAIAAGGLIASVLIKPGFRAHQTTFRMEPVFTYEPATTKPAALEPTDPAVAQPRLSSAAARASVRSTGDSGAVRRKLVEILEAPSGLYLFSRGWLERRLIRAVTPGQRVLLDFLRPISVWSWSRGWMIALGLIMVSRLLQLAGDTSLWHVVLVCVALGLFALPVLGGNWAGFQSAPDHHLQIGLHAFLPIGFWAPVRAILVINALRTAAAFPLVVLGLRYGIETGPWPWMETFAWALRVSLAVLTVQPIWVLVAFSKTTNDTSAHWWFTVLLWLALVVGLFVVVTAGVALFAAPELWQGLLAGIVGFAYTHFVLAGYALAYRRGVYDLISRYKPARF